VVGKGKKVELTRRARLSTAQGEGVRHMVLGWAARGAEPRCGPAGHSVRAVRAKVVDWAGAGSCRID